MKRILQMVLLLVSILYLSACTEVTSYVHKPSKEFRKTGDNQTQALEPFKDGDILFVITYAYTGGLSNTPSLNLWLSLYSSKSEKIVLIKDVRAKSGIRDDYQEINETLALDESIVLNNGKWSRDYSDGGKLYNYKSLLILNEYPESKLPEPFKHLDLTVTYLLESEEKEMTFKIERVKTLGLVTV